MNRLNRRVHIIVHVGFVLVGVVTTLLGAMLPVLAGRWAFDDAAAGRLFAAQFTGALAGVAVSVQLARRCGMINAIAGGFGLIAAGVAGVISESSLPGAFAIALYGIGLGITNPLINLLVARYSRRGRAAALNILSLMWGIGAVSSAPLFNWFSVYQQRLGVPCLMLAGLFSLLAALLLMFGNKQHIAPEIADEALAVGEANSPQRFQPDKQKVEPNVDRQSTDRPSTSHTGDAVTHARNTCSSSWLTVFGAIMFLYVGAETAVGGWISSYVLRDGVTNRYAAAATSAYWATVMSGRLVAPLILRRVSVEHHTLASIVLAFVGLLVLLQPMSHYGLILAASSLIGFGFAPIFPNTLATITDRCGARSSHIMQAMFALGSIGGGVLSYVVGLVSQKGDDLRDGLAVIALAAIGLMMLQIVVIKKSRHRVLGM